MSSHAVMQSHLYKHSLYLYTRLQTITTNSVTVVQHFMHFSLLLQGVSLIARPSLSFFVTCVCPKSENREGKPENEARKEKPQYPNNIICTHSWNIFFFSSVRLLMLQWLSKGFWLYPDWQLLVTFHLPTGGNG